MSDQKQDSRRRAADPTGIQFESKPQKPISIPLSQPVKGADLISSGTFSASLFSSPPAKRKPSFLGVVRRMAKLYSRGQLLAVLTLRLVKQLPIIINIRMNVEAPGDETVRSPDPSKTKTLEVIKSQKNLNSATYFNVHE